MNPCRKTTAGFTLIEVLLCCLLGSLLLLILLAGILAAQRSLLATRVSVEGEVFAVAPAYAPFPAAVRLQERFLEHFSEARACYVFGGSYPEGENTLRPGCAPLAAQKLPVISGFSAGLPRDAASFFQCYADSLGAVAPLSGPSDFSVLLIGKREGGLAVSCLVQVRGAEVQPEGLIGNWRLFHVRLFDAEGEQAGYAFLERPQTASAYVAGARHTWHRYDETAGIFEEGPTCVVFPDPWRFGGDAAPAAGTGFSRFTHFIPVSL